MNKSEKLILVSNSKLNLINNNLDEIVESMNNGRPLMEIARNLGVKYDTLKSNLKKLGVEVKTNQQRKGLAHRESRKKMCRLSQRALRTRASCG